MTILTMNRKELERMVGKITPELEEKITDMGTPVEEVTNETVAIEIFPNRPDLLSIENFARALNQFQGKRKTTTFTTKNSGKELVTEKSLPKEWPYAIACIVRGLTFTDEKIKSVIDIQEKLGSSMLRKRKKGGIGLYPLENITFPIRFLGRKPQDIQFRPLEGEKEMNGKQILKNHSTGREYAHICEAWETFPLFVDAKDNILSMPPIINSHELGKIDETTKDIFLEATGNNLPTLQKAMNIMVSSLIEMGGTVETIHCKQLDGKKLEIPSMQEETMSFDKEQIEKTLGIQLQEKQIKEYLTRMGIRYEKGTAFIPSYRTDILHWIDLAEEIAIAHGYNNFEPEMPDIATIGEEDTLTKQKRTIGTILAGIGLQELSTYHLTTKKNIKKTHYDFTDFVEVEESKTERDTLRMDLLSNMLQILSENSHAAYPQKLFEIGTVFSHDTKESTETGIVEKEHVAIGIIDETVTFTDIKQVVDYLFKMIDKEYEIEETEDTNYITGRVGTIIVEGKEIGTIGEIAPRALKNWKIKMPVAACELALKGLL